METVYNDPTEAAKAMKLELKAKFPGIKFSVRTSKYSGGNSIYVTWVFGPTTKAVNAVIEKYQYGKFNSMDDSYTYDSTLAVAEDGTIKELGGAKYVNAQRNYGKTHQEENAFREQAARDICALQRVEYKGPETNVSGGEKWDYNSAASNVAMKVLGASDLSKGYAGVKFTDGVNCGSWDEVIEVIPAR